MTPRPGLAPPFGVNWWRYVVILSSVALFVACLCTDAFDTPGYTYAGETETIANPGWSGLALGWVGVFFFLVMVLYPTPFAIILVPAAFLLRAGYRRSAGAMALLFIAIALYERALQQASWIANVLLFSAWFLLAKASVRVAGMLSVAAAFLILTFPFIGEVPLGPKDAVVGIQRLGLGYWLWFGSALSMALGTWAIIAIPKSRHLVSTDVDETVCASSRPLMKR